MILTIAEIPPAEGERFPRLVLGIDGKSYLVDTVHVSKFGERLWNAARSTVSRDDIDVLRGIVAVLPVVPIIPPSLPFYPIFRDGVIVPRIPGIDR